MLATAGIQVTFASDGTKFTRGDVNGDGNVNLTDAVGTLGFLFGGDSLSCHDVADANDSGDVNLTDAIFLLEFLFAGGSEPPAPYPEKGVDPTADELSCM